MLMKNKQSGFTMIEMMVSSFVLAVGLLGATAAQLNALKATQETFNRTKAIYVASDIIDKMRANPAGIIAGNYNSIDTTDDINVTTACTSSAAETDVACSASEIATSDKADWKSAISNLPSGKGTVAYNAVADTFTVTVIWQERHTVNASGQTMSDTTDNNEQYGKYEITIAFNS